MKAVMYHYVRPVAATPPYDYYYLALDDFRAQLDYFADEYDLIDRETFLRAVGGDEPLSDDAVVLTFDDGLRDHYEWVFPELVARGLWGIFFVSGPLGDRPLDVHRIHVLLGSYDAEELCDALFDLVDDGTVPLQRRAEFDEMYADFGDELAVTRFKRTLNYFVPPERLNATLDTLEARFPIAAGVTPDDLYATDDQLREMHDAGMLLGAHTVTHPVLSRLSATAQEREVHESIGHVARITGDETPRCFAYPYGREETFDADTLAALRGVDCRFAFSTVPADVTDMDVTDRRFELPRRDCNEFPHGRVSVG